MTHSTHYRNKVLSYRKAHGLTIAETAAHFNIGIASITRWIKRVEPKRTRIRPWTKIDIHKLAQDIRDFPDSYHYERAKRLGVSTRGICDALKRMNVTYKKSPASSKSRCRKTTILPRENQGL
jgi:hypothetical protein